MKIRAISLLAIVKKALLISYYLEQHQCFEIKTSYLFECIFPDSDDTEKRLTLNFKQWLIFHLSAEYTQLALHNCHERDLYHERLVSVVFKDLRRPFADTFNENLNARLTPIVIRSAAFCSSHYRRPTRRSRNCKGGTRRYYFFHS